MGIAHDTRWLDAYDQVALVRSGQLSPSELVDAAIERIEADGHNAVIRATFADARHTAAAATIAAAPMAGLPFLMKDLWAATEGQVATDGNAALKALPAPAYATDSVLVGRWRAAGVSFAGRTNTPEFGLLPTTEPDAFGPTLNPWDRTRSPGGSSGGAAAAVAAGLVPVAHASDGGGSIRIPASCCGLVGLKPSQGRISAGPGEGDEAGLGVQLVVSRSVRDTAWFLDLAAGPGVGDTIVAAPPTRPYVDEVGADPGSLRIGFLAHSPRGELHPDGRAAVEHTAALLASLGHRVEAANPSILDSDEYLRPFSAMWSSNTGLNLRRLSEQLGRPATADDVEPLTWALGQRAGRFSGTDLAASLAAAVRCRRLLRAWWAVDGWDLLLTPTVADLPPKLGVMATNREDPISPFRYSGGFAAFTSAFNISHQPAISLPMHWSAPSDTAPEGLPVGVQLVADYGKEDVLIRVAAQLESAAPWAHRRPLLG